MTEGSPLIKGKIQQRTTYARIPIRNKIPMPSENDDPITAIHKLINVCLFRIEHNQPEEVESLCRTMRKEMDKIIGAEITYDSGGSGTGGW